MREALREFGDRCGTAFQIADDLLDFESDSTTLGKAVLSDVAEGKASLPLAIALKRLPPLRRRAPGSCRTRPAPTSRVATAAIPRPSRSCSRGRGRSRRSSRARARWVPRGAWPRRSATLPWTRCSASRRVRRASCSPPSAPCCLTDPAERGPVPMLPAVTQRADERKLLHEVADAVGALMEFWGFKRVMGRVWTLLYLRGEPLSRREALRASSRSPPARPR